MKAIKIGVAEDQTLFRKGLINMLNSLSNIEVVIEAVDGQDMLNQLNNMEVHLVFLDYRMPNMNGIDAARTIRQRFPEVGILMLSMYDDEELIINAIENGAGGYLTKDDEPAEMERAIISVLNTGYYLNDRTSKILVRSLMHEGKITPRFKKDSSVIQFDPDQVEVIKLLSQEHSTKEIADILSKSERTIERYKSEILEKIGAKNSIGIVMYAVKHGYINPY
ncbi:MAG: response regulator transcription factor [Crocinitomicaceae bacterium]|nr:response regulator transcription factor [Crocinitomicaceae bacterium]MBK8926645.1 response regulator transcription factor [Crocinitomicaceae bacterium]